MNCTYEQLDWDSAFFNKKVYKINGALSDNLETLTIIKELQNQQVDLVYYASNIPLTQTFIAYPTGYSITLVDKKVTYFKNIVGGYDVPDSIEAYKNDYPDNKLIELAIESGIYSRFNIDPQIGRANFEEMYKTWIVNSVNKKIALEVLVSINQNTIAGFVTLGEKNARADIGIIAVDANFRGKGIGKSLMFAAENWFNNNGYQHMQVVTQGDNAAACKLYESCGYSVDKLEYFYHFWLK